MVGFEWARIGGLLAVVMAAFGGCVSLDQHRGLERANRSLVAERESLAAQLFDERSVTDKLRDSVRSLEHDLKVSEELLANIRRENALLDDIRKQAQQQLEAMANKDLGPIAILGPKLPPQLDSALKEFADKHQGMVVYDRTAGTVKWKADLLFALGSDVVLENSMESLDAFAAILKSPAAADFEVLVTGHTDNRPIVRPETRAKHPTNWHLSAHRAIAVADVLQKLGYASSRVAVMGCGEFRPVADNSSEAGAAQNRRVEIYLVPKGSIVHEVQARQALAAPGAPGSSP